MTFYIQLEIINNRGVWPYLLWKQNMYIFYGIFQSRMAVYQYSVVLGEARLLKQEKILCPNEASFGRQFSVSAIVVYCDEYLCRRKRTGILKATISIPCLSHITNKDNPGHCWTIHIDPNSEWSILAGQRILLKQSWCNGNSILTIFGDIVIIPLLLNRSRAALEWNAHKAEDL